MQANTQISLDQSQVFLSDCVELAHLQLKQRLEALKRGETIDWKETRDIVREGRTAARQLAQIASLELRDRAQDQRAIPRATRRASARPMPALKVPLTLEMAQRFLNGFMEWQAASIKANGPTPMPEAMRQVMLEVGLDPADESNLELLMNLFEDQFAASKAA